MNDNEIMLGTFAAICFIGYLLVSVWVISGQRKTIDTLTSKLMAKDFREYSASQKPFEALKEPRTQRLSYWDDEQEVREQ